MANIDELITRIDKLISTIEIIGNTPNGYQLDEDDIRKKFEIETEKNMQKIQEESNKKQEEEEKKTLENIEKRTRDHSKNKIQLLNE